MSVSSAVACTYRTYSAVTIHKTYLQQFNDLQTKQCWQNYACSTFALICLLHICFCPGLSMKLIESTPRGLNFFAFEHSKFYQKIQFEFLDAVESLEPQNVVVSAGYC
jgi:hypothetical protein